jgi:hypothetical protein
MRGSSSAPTHVSASPRGMPPCGHRRLTWDPLACGQRLGLRRAATGAPEALGPVWAGTRKKYQYTAHIAAISVMMSATRAGVRRRRRGRRRGLDSDALRDRTGYRLLRITREVCLNRPALVCCRSPAGDAAERVVPDSSYHPRTRYTA